MSPRLRTSLAVALLAVALLASVVQAHVALWHPSMYGFCDCGDGTDGCCINTSNPVNPCQDETFGPGVGGSGWWMHGNINQPPAPDTYFEFPSGGTIHTELACNKGQTSWNIGEAALNQTYACWGPPPLHTADTFEAGPTGDTKGCAIALAWQDDVTKLTPDDMIVVTTNRTCPFYMHTDFDIPDDLPPCPEGGCHAFWLWIHEAGDFGGYSYQMYLSPFKVKITGSTRTDPLPPPRVAQKCVDAPDLCIKGPKAPHYWSMMDRNNAFNPFNDPPYYNEDYGWTNGAQKDLRYVADPVAESSWLSEWEPMGCWGDNGRMLNGSFVDTWQNDVDFCLATCAGWKYAGVQYGSQCGCGDYITGSEMSADNCPMACANNATELCGGGGTQNLYRRKTTSLVTASSSSAAPSSSAPPSSSSLPSSFYASSASAAASYTASLSSRASSSAAAATSSSAAALVSAPDSKLAGSSSSLSVPFYAASSGTVRSPAQITACLTPTQRIQRLEAALKCTAPTSSSYRLTARATGSLDPVPTAPLDEAVDAAGNAGAVQGLEAHLKKRSHAWTDMHRRKQERLRLRWDEELALDK